MLALRLALANAALAASQEDNPMQALQTVEMERFYLGCLAHASYMVASDGIAAVIDPQRDVEIYLEAAASKGWKIEYIIETHLHADFVSGHQELAQRTGAKIYIGAKSGAEFDHVPAKDGDTLRFGACSLEFLETPGHTLESMCVVMRDLSQPQRPAIVFTGDTLFVGDVGRPDLSATHTPQELAACLYHSLHDKLLTLPDDTEIFPAHGAGSLCGRNMSAESSSTIGKQKQTNYALMARSSDELVHLLTDNMTAAPEYFAGEVALNRRGANAVSTLPELRPLTAADAAHLATLPGNQAAIIVDTRPAPDFAAAHLPHSLHIALTGQYASWAARILGLDTTLILVTEDTQSLRESQLRLARVGIERIAGYLAGGITAWVNAGHPLESTTQITAPDLAAWLSEETPLTILDVREPTEAETGHIPNSINIPLGTLKSRLAEIDPTHPVVVHCKGGYRSSIATSLLRQANIPEVIDLIGGFDAWKMAGLDWRSQSQDDALCRGRKKEQLC